MKILVINTGSSSIKYELFDMTNGKAVASGQVEKIGEDTSKLTYKKRLDNDGVDVTVRDGKVDNHHEGLIQVVDVLMDPEHGVIQDKSDITAVGHRVVHGGETFHSPTILDEKVIAAIKDNIPLAPLHNPPNLEGIEVARKIFESSPQVAVFDTAFHQTIPMRAFLFAIPFELYEKEKVRRYGFHGTSHAFVAESAAAYLGKPLEELNLITIHLGNGASMAAVKNGKCIDTSMGMTPLAGLVMGTRCGDLDPAIPFFLADQLKMSLKEIDNLLNKDSGLKGVCGTNDMREVIEKRDAGDPRAEAALDLYTYRIKQYIGAYFAALGHLDGIVFTAGIGENSPQVREQSCDGLNKMGIDIDPDKNRRDTNGIREINTLESDVKVLVVPTNEELKIALETRKVIEDRFS